MMVLPHGFDAILWAALLASPAAAQISTSAPNSTADNATNTTVPSYTGPVSLLPRDGLLEHAKMQVGWAADIAGVDVDSEEIAMVCYPKACPAEGEEGLTIVHRIKKNGYDGAGTMSQEVYTSTYPTSAAPQRYDLGGCNGNNANQANGGSSYQPAVESFGIYLQNFGDDNDGGETEGEKFNQRTRLARRAIAGDGGLLGTHDSFDLTDNKWGEIAGVQTSAGYPYGAGRTVDDGANGTKVVGPTRYSQQFFVWGENQTLSLDGDSLHVDKCALLHLAYFERVQGLSGQIRARWKFKGPTVSGPEFLKNAKVAVRYVDADTIGIEVEKQHFESLTKANAIQANLPHFTANDSLTYVRLYEWKTKVYCANSTITNEAGLKAGLPTLTLQPQATTGATVKGKAPPQAEVTARDLVVETYQETRGSASYTLAEVSIPNDGQPLHFRMWDEPAFAGWDSVDINLVWNNLPSVGECPVIAWDPTFHALPAAPQDASNYWEQAKSSAGSPRVASWGAVFKVLVVLVWGTLCSNV